MKPKITSTEHALACIILPKIPSHALRLAAQILNVAPCEHCDYIKIYCKCYEGAKGGN